MSLLPVVLLSAIVLSIAYQPVEKFVLGLTCVTGRYDLRR